MKNKSAISALCIVLLVAALCSAGCTSVFPGGTKATPTPLPATVPAPMPADTLSPIICGFTTCHGTDLACGTNAPQICTEEYRTGDRCRQYARCDASGGICTLVTTNPQYTACKACAERCQVQAGPDSLAASTCEEKC
ncbi:MAG: hypothetical protein WCB46_06265 [Methanoregula sp.]